MSSRLLSRRAAAGLAVAVTTLAAGCGGESGNADVDPASVLPANAPVYVEVTVRPDGDLKANVEAAARKVLRTDDPGGAIIKAFDKAIADETDKKNFKDDIDPWLGNKIGVAITSLRNVQEPDFALAIASKDNDKAIESLEDKNTSEAEYEGVKYLKQKSDGTVAGPVGDTIVIGTEAAFKSAVDAEKGDRQLDDSKGLQDARKGISEDEALGFVYVDLAQGLAALSASQPLIASQLDPLKKLLGGASTLSAAIAVADDAIRVETAQIGGPAGAVTGDPAKTLASLPAGTVLGLGLGEVGAALKQGIDQIASVGPIAGQDPQALLSGLETQLGLSVEKDLLSWMGEGAVFVRGKSVADIGGGLLVRSTDPATTKKTLAKLPGLLRQFGAPVTAKAPDGAEAGFRVPLQSGGGIELLVGLKDDRFVIGVGPGLVKQTLEASAGGRLGDDAAFKAAAAKLGDGIQPSFYLDLPTVVNFLALAVGSDADFAKAKPYLDAFTAVVAGGKRDGDTNRFRIVLGLK